MIATLNTTNLLDLDSNTFVTMLEVISDILCTTYGIPIKKGSRLYDDFLGIATSRIERIMPDYPRDAFVKEFNILTDNT